MRYLNFLILLLLASMAYAQPGKQDYKATLEKNIPGSKFRSVVESPVKGLYEATNAVDGSIIYATLDGRYVLSGYLYDRSTDSNLTTLAVMQAVSDSDTVVFAPKEKETKHTITVFTDTDCGYCRRLHQEISQLNDYGIKVRYMLYPRAGLGSPTYKTLQSIWCAKDQRSALTAAKNGEQIEEKTCANPIEEHVSVAHALGLRGTPLIVTDKGDVINGYRPARTLAAQLEGVITP